MRAVWEGIRRERAQPTDQAPALMPPVLWEMCCPLFPTICPGSGTGRCCWWGFVGGVRRELAASTTRRTAPSSLADRRVSRRVSRRVTLGL